MTPTKNQMESDSPRPVPCAIGNSRHFESYAVCRLVCGPEISDPPRLRSGRFLPEDNVEYDEDRRDNTGPEDRLLPDGRRSVMRNDGCPINEAVQLRVRPRCRHVAHRDCYDDADDPAPQRAEHVVRHRL